MITAAQWVPRGFAAPFPKKYDFDEAEFERIADLAKLQLEDAEEDLKEAQEEDESDEEESQSAEKKKGGQKGDTKSKKEEPEKIKLVIHMPYGSSVSC